MSDLELLIPRATTAGLARVYKLGAVPASPTYPYAVASLDTGTPSTYTLDGSSDTRRRLVLQMFSRTLDGLQSVADAADDAFRDVPLTELPDSPISNRELSTQPIRDPDAAGVMYVLHTYQYGES